MTGPKQPGGVESSAHAVQPPTRVCSHSVKFNILSVLLQKFCKHNSWETIRSNERSAHFSFGKNSVLLKKYEYVHMEYRAHYVRCHGIRIDEWQSGMMTNSGEQLLRGGTSLSFRCYTSQLPLKPGALQDKLKQEGQGWDSRHEERLWDNVFTVSVVKVCFTHFVVSLWLFLNHCLTALPLN